MVKPGPRPWRRVMSLLVSGRVWVRRNLILMGWAGPFSAHSQGFFKVLGKGKLPDVPLVVKAKYFSKDVRTDRSCTMGMMVLGGVGDMPDFRLEGGRGLRPWCGSPLGIG